jgi:hypothetical protein
MLERNNPDSLTNDIINRIGINYLTHYPNSTFKHSHQKNAAVLANYRENNSPREKWEFLLSQWIRIPSEGELVSAITGLFDIAFESKLKYNSSGLYPFNTIIRDHYSARLYSMVNDIHQQLRTPFNARPVSLVATRSFLNTPPGSSAVVNTELDPLAGRVPRKYS